MRVDGRNSILEKDFAELFNYQSEMKSYRMVEQWPHMHSPYNFINFRRKVHTRKKRQQVLIWPKRKIISSMAANWIERLNREIIRMLKRTFQKAQIIFSGFRNTKHLFLNIVIKLHLSSSQLKTFQYISQFNAS